MNRERWLDIKPILDVALDLPSRERPAYLDRSCGDDEDLRREIECYLEIDTGETDYLEEPVLDLIAGRSPEFRSGERIGSYRLDEEMARGGMGVVYRASRVEGDFEQTVAIKILKRGFDTGELVRRFRQERQILARLVHPHIARLLDGGATDDGLPYLVMEVVDGTRLDAYCAANRPSLRERLELVIAIAEAVHFAHRNLVVHCDLKPSNVLVGPDGAPKLLDFGIAKVLREGHDPQTRSLALRLGTVGYASPEQLEGDAITTGADVYALGALLYRLLAGTTPARPTGPLHPLPSPRRLLEERLGEDPDAPPELDDLRASLRRSQRDLDAIVRKAMAWDPTERYDSAAELADDLRRHLDHRPILARRYAFWDDAALFARRHWRALLVTVGFLAIFVLAGIGWLDARSSTARANATLDAYLEILYLVDPNSDVPEAEAIQRALQTTSVEALADPETQARIENVLGNFFVRINRYTEARPLLEKALARRREAGRQEDLAVSLNNLALLESATGNLSKAEEGFRESLRIYEDNPDLDRTQRLDVLNNLARIEERRGRLEEAEAIDRQVLADRMSLLGETDRAVEESLANLGQVLVRQQKLTEAEPLLLRALELRRSRLGAASAKNLSIENNLATLNLDLGNVEEAIDLYRSVLVRRVDLFGDESLLVARSRSALAVALLERGSPDDLERAEDLLRRADEINRQELPADHSHRLWIEKNLASAVLANGRPEEAEPILRDVIDRAERWEEQGHWMLVDTKSLLGEALLQQKRLDEARPLLEGAPEILAETKGEGSRYVRDARRRWQAWQEAAGETDAGT